MSFDVNSNGNANHYDKFHAYLVELLENYTKLAVLLSKKLTAISKFDIATLDSIIKEEQVFVLLARGFDSTLQSYREKMNLKCDTLKAAIMEMPEEYRPRFQDVYSHLKIKLDEVRGLNEKCQSLIEERIYNLEKSIRRLDTSTNTSYGKPGSSTKPDSGGHMLTKSV